MHWCLCGKGSLCHPSEEHHPTTGSEDMLARCGFPTTRLNLRALKDLKHVRLARLASSLLAPPFRCHVLD